MSPPDDSPVPPSKPPGSGPRYETLIEQMAAWMEVRQAARTLEDTP